MSEELPEAEFFFCLVCEDQTSRCRPEICPGEAPDPPVANYREEVAKMEAEDLACDQLEASSGRYIIGLRLMLLTSGHWAIFQGGEQGLSQLEILESLDLGRLQALGEEELVERSKEPPKRVWAEPENSSAPEGQSLEDLGL